MAIGPVILGVLALVIGLALPASGQTADDRFAQLRARAQGMTIFREHCVSCHGLTGHGDGPRLEELSVPPSDLTRLAERNGGIFPAATVTRVIDGADRVHHSGEMPLWGTVFRADPAVADEQAVKERLTALTLYLEFFQVRPRRQR